jgi:hypothetical protein
MWRQNNAQPVELPHPTRIEDLGWSATVSCSEQRISDEIQFLNLDSMSIK